jgi:hypothetical protein
VRASSQRARWTVSIGWSLDIAGRVELGRLVEGLGLSRPALLRGRIESRSIPCRGGGERRSPKTRCSTTGWSTWRSARSARSPAATSARCSIGCRADLGRLGGACRPVCSHAAPHGTAVERIAGPAVLGHSASPASIPRRRSTRSRRPSPCSAGGSPTRSLRNCGGRGEIGELTVASGPCSVSSYGAVGVPSAFGKFNSSRKT